MPIAVTTNRLDWRSKFFVGWFGQRGLASVVFALIAMEDLRGVSGTVDVAVVTIGLTVLASVVLHGLTRSHWWPGMRPEEWWSRPPRRSRARRLSRSVIWSDTSAPHRGTIRPRDGCPSPDRGESPGLSASRTLGITTDSRAGDP